MAPVAAATFGAAPVVVGGAGIVAAGTSGINAYNNFTGNNFLTNNNPEHTKNNWSGALDAGTTVMAAAPFATRGGRNAMFGADARAQTALTANRALTGARNFPTRALNAADQVGYGARVLAAELSPPVVTPEGMMAKPPIPEAPTPRPLIPAPQKPQPMRVQGNPEGPQGAGTQGKGATSQNEQGVGKSDDLPPAIDVGANQPNRQVALKKLRYSQGDVSPKMSGADGKKVPIGTVADDMKANGFPVDAAPTVVEYPDESLVSLDHRRLVAADKAGIQEVPAHVKLSTSRLPQDQINNGRFTLKAKEPITDPRTGKVYQPDDVAETYGEAALFRSANQRTLRDKKTGELLFPDFPLEGSPEVPRIKDK
jgi:hypothetical protein